MPSPSVKGLVRAQADSQLATLPVPSTAHQAPGSAAIAACDAQKSEADVVEKSPSWPSLLTNIVATDCAVAVSMWVTASKAANLVVLHMLLQMDIRSA